MKILVAADSFKDSLDSLRVCEAICRGLKQANANFEISIFPLADGGEGTSDILAYHLGGKKAKIKVCDPLFRTIEADYLISGDNKTAFIEMAKASGLQLLSTSERNPLLTSTFGVGQMIQDAIEKGVEKITLAIGGSATNEGGIGMATALGIELYDGHNTKLRGTGEDLGHLAKISFNENTRKKLSKISFSVICDVTNQLSGPTGASFIYGAQKGADDNMIKILDTGLIKLAKLTKADDLANLPGAGAAGGLGFGAMTFLGAKLFRGIDMIMQMTDFEKHIQGVDVIITGEGRIDDQTSEGKLIHGVASMGLKYHIPVIALCGSLGLNSKIIKDLGLTAAFSITPHPVDLDIALRDTEINLETTSYNVGKLLNLLHN